ncbi:MAG: penicillin-binding protein activator [Rickettsiella sp.]|nr:penicillin-binding protein activator [Rickettsiella sp.]
MSFLFSRLLLSIILLFSSSIYLSGCSQNSANAPSPVPADMLSRNLRNNFPLANPKIIALLVPLQGQLGPIGQAIKQGFLTAAQENGSNAQIIIIDTTKEPTIQAAYNKALAQKAQFVVGPLLKPQVQVLAGLELSTPVLALNYLNSDISTPAELYQFGLSPLDEAQELTTKAWQSGRRSALIMTSSWGSQIAQTFADEWKNLGGHVVERLTLSQNSSALTGQIRRFLQFKPPHEIRTDFDVIFLASDPKTARQVKPLLKFYFAGDIPVYATASIYSGRPNSRLDNDLNGIIFCSTPWSLGRGAGAPNRLLYEKLQAANSLEFFRHYRSYYALGVDALHIAQQLSSLANSQILAGATGQLSLKQHRIVRQMPCAQFRRGHITLIN